MAHVVAAELGAGLEDKQNDLLDRPLGVRESEDDLARGERPLGDVVGQESEVARHDIDI